MSDQTPKKRRMTNQTYPKRVPGYDTEVGIRLWRAIARKRKCSLAAALRQVCREEAQRLGIPVPEENGEDGNEKPTPT